MSPYADVPRWISRLLATPPSEPATFPLESDLGVNLHDLQAKLDPQYHAALQAAINSITAATATDGEKPFKEALLPLLREVDGKDKKDRRWFCRFDGCRWKDVGYNRSDRAVAHLLKDHFNMRFECPEEGCGREFKWKHDLQAHLQRDHAPDGVAPSVSFASIAVRTSHVIPSLVPPACPHR